MFDFLIDWKAFAVFGNILLYFFFFFFRLFVCFLLARFFGRRPVARMYSVLQPLSEIAREM